MGYMGKKCPLYSIPVNSLWSFSVTSISLIKNFLDIKVPKVEEALTYMRFSNSLEVCVFIFQRYSCIQILASVCHFYLPPARNLR